eukprot:m.1657460 g.1657460  ORF g.1657460 m.1657460 type:complete len:71 (+) comp112567_c0_seq1:110-322(+)
MKCYAAIDEALRNSKTKHLQSFRLHRSNNGKSFSDSIKDHETASSHQHMQRMQRSGNSHDGGSTQPRSLP